MKKILLALALVFVFTISLVDVKSYSGDLDYIHEYIVVADPNEDGTINLTYKFKWEVLNSTKEGPLEWVRIGMPNSKFSNAIALTNNIDKISRDGSNTRIDFDKKYYEGEVIDFSFSVTQDYFFNVDGDDIQFEYIPGWFDEIKIGHLMVMWDKEGMVYCNTSTIVGDYLVWDAYNIDHGKSIECHVVYDVSFFPTINLEHSVTNVPDYSWIIVLVVVVLFICFVILIVIVSEANKDAYYDCRGFTGRNYYRHYWYYHHYGCARGVNKKGKPYVNPNRSSVSTSGRSFGSSGRSCACACACACAGGGRAGCARKDFYHPSLEMHVFHKAIEKE